MVDMEDAIETPDIRKPKVKIQKGWKNAPSVEDLRADWNAAENGQNEFRIRLLDYERTREGGQEITVTGVGKSTARPLVVRKANEWKYPALEDPILSSNSLFNISPRNPADEAAATQNGQMLNYQWNTQIQKTKLVTDIVRTVVDEGTVIVKTGWETETAIKEVEEEVPVYASPEESLAMMQQLVQSGQMSPEQARAMLETGEPMQTGTKMEMVEKEVLTKNQPSYEVCLNANVIIDPTCDGVVADALFAIHEYDTSFAELENNKYEKDEDGEEFGFYHNLDYVLPDDGDPDYDAYKSVESNNFEFGDKPRKRMRAYEYWGYWDVHGEGTLTSIVATWIGNTMIRLEENPFPHGRIPFSVTTYMPIKKSVHGEPDAALLKENQESIGNMTRAIHDITARQAVGQEFIDENLFPSPSAKNQYEKGNTVYYRTGFDPQKAIYRKDVQQVNSTPFDVINWQQQDANELTGTKAFAGPGGARMNGSKQDRDSMDATAKRELSILRRLSDLLFVDMARMTISMNQVFLSEEEVIRVTDREFISIRREDLQGEFDLKIKVSTPERDEDQAQKLMTLLQTNAATMDPEIVKLHYIKLAQLWKHEDLAEAVKNFEPAGPSPQEQELMQLQLDEQKLKNALAQKQLEDYDSKIFERLSRQEENLSADVALKQAKAAQAISTAAKIDEETDILAQSFLEIQTGSKRQAEIEDQEFALQGEMAKEEQKTMAQAGMEHIKNSYARSPGKVLAEI